MPQACDPVNHVTKSVMNRFNSRHTVPTSSDNAHRADTRPPAAPPEVAISTDARGGSRPQPSMSDVARHAGVAIGTVSNTLNSPEKVSERTRRKVLGAIAELGFVRNDAARSLAAGSSTTIGLVLADLGNSFFVDIARGVEQVMRRRGFDVLIANTEIDRDREVRNLELFERSRVAGILFAPLDTPLAHSGVLPIRSTPTVLVNFTSDTNAYPSVAVDEQRGGALAASHVLERGARRMLFVGGPLFLTAVGDRHRRCVSAAEADRFPDAQLELLETRGLNIRHGRQAAQLILERGAGTYDAIVAASDLLAMGIVQVLDDVPGFSVPGDIDDHRLRQQPLRVRELDPDLDGQPAGRGDGPHRRRPAAGEDRESRRRQPRGHPLPASGATTLHAGRQLAARLSTSAYAATTPAAHARRSGPSRIIGGVPPPPGHRKHHGDHMPYRDQATVEGWVREFLESNVNTAAEVSVVDKDFTAGPDSGSGRRVVAQRVDCHLHPARDPRGRAPVARHLRGPWRELRSGFRRRRADSRPI